MAAFTDVEALRANQCCELHLRGNGKSAWGIYKQHDGTSYLRRVPTKFGERFGPCNPEQACARELILDDQSLVVSLVGIAGTGKTLMALLSAYELYRAGKVSKIEVYRLNAEAGRGLGFLPGDLGDKMAPWAKPILDNLDFIMRRLHGGRAFTNQIADAHAERREPATHPSVEDLLANRVLEIAPINYLRGRSIHDAVIIVDDGQNLTQEDMKLVLTRAGEGARVVLTGDPDQIDRAEIDAVCARFVGAIDQVPPMHSALKHRGRALYAYARAGVTVERAPRRVTIHRLDVVGWDGGRLVLDVACSKGTYVRTLAEDLGAALGCGAHLAALRRTASGALSVDDATTLDALQALDEPGRDARLLPPDALVSHWPPVALPDDEAGRFLAGLRRRVGLPDAPAVRVYGPQPRAFLGSAHITAGELIADRLLSPAEVAGLLESREPS